MEKITLNQLTTVTSIHVIQLLILNEEKIITNIDFSILREYENYRVVSIEPLMESSYNEVFKTMTIESGICLTLIKN